MTKLKRKLSGEFFLISTLSPTCCYSFSPYIFKSVVYVTVCNLTSQQSYEESRAAFITPTLRMRKLRFREEQKLAMAELNPDLLTPNLLCCPKHHDVSWGLLVPVLPEKINTSPILPVTTFHGSVHWLFVSNLAVSARESQGSTKGKSLN